MGRIADRTKKANRTQITMKIGPKVAPRVDTLFTNGDDSLQYLAESLDETWASYKVIKKICKVERPCTTRAFVRRLTVWRGSPRSLLQHQRMGSR
ncbi:hypothetical protein BKA80DRAFT_263464 [Phyllosticta citrichinensis]